MIQLHYSGLVLKISEEYVNTIGTKNLIYMQELLLSTESNPLFEFFDPYYSRNPFSYWTDRPGFPMEYLVNTDYHYNHTYINSGFRSNPNERQGYDKLSYGAYFNILFA